MSLDRAIKAGAEHRAPYRKSAQFDPSCRHGGSCPYCEGNRTHAGTKRERAARDDIQQELRHE